jgi:4-hydroxybenzoate polyprenyltransferase
MVVCGETPAKRPQGELSDYISIMRLDHAIKHIFIIPGILLALMLRGDHGSFRVNTFLLTLLSCLLSASANYVINEWFDAPFDAHHPSKFRRPCVAHRLNGSLVAAEYLGLAILSLVLGYFVAPLVCYAAAALLISGILYNVQPLRLKDHAFVDVWWGVFDEYQTVG